MLVNSLSLSIFPQLTIGDRGKRGVRRDNTGHCEEEAAFDI